MPILIKDFSWRQTDDLVIVRVPLRNIPHKKVDLFHSDVFIKVHFPPFLFECCLYELINEDESKCTLVEGEAVFELAKTEKKEWPSLQKEVSKQEMLIIKKEAIEHAQTKAADLKDKKKEKQRKRRSDCIGQQMALDEQRRGIIEEKKTNEKTMAFNEIMEWKEKETDKNFLPSPMEKAANIIKSWSGRGIGIDSKTNDEKKKEVEEAIDTDGESDIEKENTNEINGNKPLGVTTEKEVLPKADGPRDDKEIWKREEVHNCEPLKKIPGLKKLKTSPYTINKNDKDFIPPLRQYGSINVDFTYRAFPTPSRESTHKEEQEWLMKQKEARRKTGFVVEELRPEENDPIWLLEKGKSFHEAENYLGAISAFTHALRTWNKIPELYVARSNSQLCIGNYRRVLEDTCDVLDLLKPHVESNAELRFQAHYNRGKALIELGKPTSALADFVEALEIHPYREDIHNLMDRAESLIEEEKATPPEPQKEPGVGQVEEEFIEPEVLAN